MARIVKNPVFTFRPTKKTLMVLKTLGIIRKDNKIYAGSNFSRVVNRGIEKMSIGMDEDDRQLLNYNVLREDVVELQKKVEHYHVEIDKCVEKMRQIKNSSPTLKAKIEQFWE